MVTMKKTIFQFTYSCFKASCILFLVQYSHFHKRIIFTKEELPIFCCIQEWKVIFRAQAKLINMLNRPPEIEFQTLYFWASLITEFLLILIMEVTQVSQLTGTMIEAERVASWMSGRLKEGCVSAGAWASTLPSEVKSLSISGNY